MKVQCKVSKTKYVILDDLIEPSTIKEFKTKFKINYKERSNYEPLIIFKGDILYKEALVITLTLTFFIGSPVLESIIIPLTSPILLYFYNSGF